MRRSLVFALTFLAAFASQAQPGPTGEFKYPHRILPDEVYDSSVPTPASLLGFEGGDRAAFPDEILEVFRAMADASPRAVLFEHGHTHEGRMALHETNQALEEITHQRQRRTALPGGDQGERLLLKRA